MTKKERIEREIDKTLQQFDNQEKLPANPYFYTRIQQQLDEKRKHRKIYAAIIRPAWIVLLVIINLGTALWYFRGSAENFQTDSQQQLIEVLSNDLKLNTHETNLLFTE